MRLKQTICITAAAAGIALLSSMPVQFETNVLATRVIDGDTIEIEGGERVRYIGIDAPEVAHGEQAADCFGPEAAAENAHLVSGKSVTLRAETDDRDRYGRLLRHVFVGGKEVGLRLVEAGYARAMPIAPNIKFSSIFRQKEREARAHKRGQWSVCRH